MAPKVSIVVPVYNVEKYLAECLDSLSQQTLRDIEIIVVNDGSTDGSLGIAQEFAKKDTRFSIIDKANAGYGHSMNRGFERARGEYIGIVESDDCARPDMFQKLYDQASQYDADVARSNYYTMKNDSEFCLIDVLGLSEAPYGESFNPQDFPRIVLGSPAIWTAIYRNDFIKSNGITFLETPGASYQDTGFILKVWAAATKVVFLREAFLNYRIDNEGSSVKSGAKVFCVCDEYSSFEDFISSRPERFNAFKYILPVKKYETYLWNYNRLDGSLRAEFLKKMSEEFASAQERGLLDEKLFADVEWRELQMVINSPDSLHGKDLTVVPSVLNPYDHQKTRCVNGEISAAYLFAWRLKHAFR